MLDYCCSEPETVADEISRLPPGCWISMTRRRAISAEYGDPRPWGWLGKIQCDGHKAPSRHLWTPGPCEMVCRLPGLWLELYGEEFGGTSDDEAQ